MSWLMQGSRLSAWSLALRPWLLPADGRLALLPCTCALCFGLAMWPGALSLWPGASVIGLALEPLLLSRVLHKNILFIEWDFKGCYKTLKGLLDL